MAAPIFNIVLGIACIVGGASGKLTLIGTSSGPALVVAGVVAVGLGAFQIWRRKSGAR